MLGIPSFNGSAVGSLAGHNNPDYLPNLNRSGGVNSPTSGSTLPSSPLLMPNHDGLSDTDSLRKPCWSDVETNLKGTYYESSKIQNGKSALYTPSKRLLLANPNASIASVHFCLSIFCLPRYLYCHSIYNSLRPSPLSNKSTSWFVRIFKNRKRGRVSWYPDPSSCSLMSNLSQRQRSLMASGVGGMTFMLPLEWARVRQAVRSGSPPCMIKSPPLTPGLCIRS